MGKAEFLEAKHIPAGKEHREVEGDFGGPQEGDDGVQADYTSEEHFFDVDMGTEKEEVGKWKGWRWNRPNSFPSGLEAEGNTAW